MRIGVRAIILDVGTAVLLFGEVALAQTAMHQEGAADLPPNLFAILQDNSNPAVKRCIDLQHVPFEKMVHTSWLDLNPTQQPALLVEGLPPCLSGSDNGTKLFYIRSDDGWRKILDGLGARVELKVTRTHGWRDIVLWRHNSAFDSTQLLYQFDGNVYRAIRCNLVESANPLTGKRRSPPKYSPCTWDWQGARL